MPRNLRLLWAAQFISLAGDWLYLTVIVNYTLKVTAGSERAAGLVVAAEYLPYLLLGAWAGVLVDRLDRRRVMLWADLFRAGILAALYAADRAGWMQGLGPGAALPVGAAALLLTTGAVFFAPARDALLPELAEGGDLLKANAAIALSQYGAGLLGPLLAAGLLAARPLAESFLWDALTFLCSFACLAAMRMPARPPAPQGAGASAPPDVRGALRYVLGRGDLSALLVFTALNNLFIMGPAYVCSPILVNQVARDGGLFALPGWLGGRVLGKEAMFALFLAVFSAGMVAGSLLVKRLGSVPRWKLLGVGVLLDGLTFLPFEPVARAASFPGLLLALFAHAFVVPLIVVVRPAVVQTHVPRERLGQVFSLINITVYGFLAISSILTGWLLGAGIRPGRLFTCAALGGALSGIAALTIRPLRRLT